MSRFRAAFTAAALVACAAVAVFCGSAGEDDGASCDTSKDCKSGTCTGGACAGSACACDAGVCEAGAGCQAGWVCVSYDDEPGVTPAIRCERTCTGPGSCPAERHCERGVCKDGPEKLVITWSKEPGVEPCQIFKPCSYGVQVLGGDVDHFDWTFGELDAGVTTLDASAEYSFHVVGPHRVTVVATDKGGVTAELDGTENPCVDGVAVTCSPGFADCCHGNCVVDAGTCL